MDTNIFHYFIYQYFSPGAAIEHHRPAVNLHLDKARGAKK